MKYYNQTPKLTTRSSTSEISGFEYVIWGVPKGETDERVLYTKAKSLLGCNDIAAALEKKYGCTEVRIQVVDMGVDDIAQRFSGKRS